MKVIVVPSAQRDIRDIRTYIWKNNRTAAVSVVRAIDRHIGFLADHPELGHEDDVQGTRRLSVAGTPYIVIYHLRAGVIYVVRIIHGAMRWPPNGDEE